MFFNIIYSFVNNNSDEIKINEFTYEMNSTFLKFMRGMKGYENASGIKKIYFCKFFHNTRLN